MQRQSYEFVEVSNGQYHLPITLKQSNGKVRKLASFVLTATLAGMIVVPQIALALYALASPEVRTALIEHPGAALELAVAFAFWVALVSWPLRNIFMALISHRLVEIRDGEVKVIDKTPFSSSFWRAPLMAYDGIALRLRSSLSGIRQEAVLVHPNRSKCVVLMVADRIAEREIIELCGVLNLPHIPGGRLHDLGGPTGGRKASVDLAPIAA